MRICVVYVVYKRETQISAPIVYAVCRKLSWKKAESLNVCIADAVAALANKTWPAKSHLYELYFNFIDHIQFTNVNEDKD